MKLDETMLRAQEQAKIAAESEADFKDLERRESIVLAEEINLYRSRYSDCSYQWAKNYALASQAYRIHLEFMKSAQEKYLAAEKDFRVLIDYIRAVTSENYRLNAEYKAGK